MGQIIFSRTRHVYDSYVDFWRLVELSGFHWVYYDQIDFQSDNLYIHSPMNGNYREFLSSHARDRRCTLAHWLLERPTPEGKETPVEALRRYRDANRELEAMRYVDVTVVSDPLLSERTGFKYIPMGSHRDLGEWSPDKAYDFVGLMAPYPRRMFLFNGDKVKSEWEGMTFAPNANGIHEADLRDLCLRASRFGLNIHNDVHPYCEPLRFAVFAAYALPIVTETLSFGTIYHMSVCQSDYPNLRNAMKAALDRYDVWVEWGKYLHAEMTSTGSFRRRLEENL